MATLKYMIKNLESPILILYGMECLLMECLPISSNGMSIQWNVFYSQWNVFYLLWTLFYLQWKVFNFEKRVFEINTQINQNTFDRT